MSKKSAGSLYVTVNGDAQPLITTLKAADEAVRQRSASMAAQVEKLGKDITKNFSFAKFGKDMLSGFGIGSAAGVTMSVVDHFVGKWRESEEYAKNLEERAQNIAAIMKQLSATRFDFAVGAADPEKRLEMLNAALARTAGQRDTFAEQREAATRKMGVLRDWEMAGNSNVVRLEGESFVRNGVPMRIRDVYDEMQKRQDEAQAKWTASQKEALSLSGQVVSAIESAAAEQRTKQDEVNKAIDKALDAFFGPIREAGKRMDDAAESLRERLKTPWDKLDESIAEINRMGSRLTPAEAEAGKALAVHQFKRDIDPSDSNEFRRWERAAGRLQVDDMTRRGLGTGGNYQEWGKQTADTLKQIYDLLRTAKATGLSATFN